MSFTAIIYSDIHHHDWDNGLKESDLLSIEQQVLDEAVKCNADLIINLGDWFQSRNPGNHLRKLVSDCISQKANQFKFACLVGNHDRETKNIDSEHVLYNHPNVIVMDECKTYYIMTQSNMIALHAIPSGHSIDFNNFDVGLTHINIALFHDVMIGACQSNGIISKFGRSLDLLDSDKFNIVLGGDVHLPQPLQFKNTVGYYIGAPCQHTWGDINQTRGIVKLHIDDDDKINYAIIPTNTPKFIKHQLVLTDLKQLQNLYELDYNNNIVSITIIGERKLLDRIDIEDFIRGIKQEHNPRLVDIILNPLIVVKDSVAGLYQHNSDSEDWSIFVSSGKLNLNNLNPDDIITTGHAILNELL
jgi:DNA repair exonuclease SbcCD nuclease subunit